MKHIILIGFMGSGKTTIGKKLARRCGWEFIDTDERIEAENGRTITSIFAESGEAHFRKLETETLKTLLKKTSPCVISVGGGLPMQEANQALLKQLGFVVFLETDIDTLEQRLSNDTKRPKLQGGNLRERIEELMEQRQDVYEQVSDCSVHTDHHSFEQILQEIQKKYAEIQ